MYPAPSPTNSPGKRGSVAKTVVCDFCENKNDFKGVSFEYSKLSVTIPRWAISGIFKVELDLCAFCYRKCFTKFSQNKLNEFSVKARKKV